MNYKKRRFNFKYFIIIVLALVLLLFIYFFAKNNKNLTFLQKICMDIGNATVNIVSYPINLINDSIEKHNDMKRIYKKYKVIEQNSEMIDLVKAENESLKKEIEELKTISNIDSKITGYQYLDATIIKRNVGYWNNTVTIDKGSTAGIVSGMVVIDSKGIIGIVTDVAYYSSDVKLITTPEINPKISVEVKEDNRTIPGLLAYYDSITSLFTIEGVSEYKNVEIGSYVYTTSYNDNIPPGILLGKVVEIRKDNYDLSKIILVSSDVDFNNIRYVKVLKKE